MRLALIQMKAAPIVNYLDTANRILQLIDAACKNGVDIVVLPECAYPAYIIGNDPDQKYITILDEFLSNISRAAKSHQTYIVIGVSRPNNNKLYNAAIVFDKNGECLGESRKSNLWHFDAKWFDAGDTSFVFNTEFGKIGVMVCADGRIPEIARMLRLNGAQLILDTVNLVANAETESQLSNQQYEFILPIRAWENGIPIAVCDKAGIEEECVCCLGRSFIALPDATIPVQCSPDKEEILLYDVELPAEKPIKNFRPQLYSLLAEPINKTQVAQDIVKSYCPQEMELYASVVRFNADTQTSYIRQAIKSLSLCSTLDAKFVVLPFASKLSKKSCDDLLKKCPESLIAMLAYEDEHEEKIVNIFSANKLLYTLRSASCSNVKTVELFEGCKVAVMFDDEFHAPEFPRIAMLQGADILIWFDTDGNTPDKKLSQTRAAENKCFVIRSGPSGHGDRSYAISPDGVPLFTTFSTDKQISCGMLNLFLSKSKTVVPGTHIVNSRIPDFYKTLTREM